MILKPPLDSNQESHSLPDSQNKSYDESPKARTEKLTPDIDGESSAFAEIQRSSALSGCSPSPQVLQQIIILFCPAISLIWISSIPFTVASSPYLDAAFPILEATSSELPD